MVVVVTAIVSVEEHSAIVEGGGEIWGGSSGQYLDSVVLDSKNVGVHSSEVDGCGSSVLRIGAGMRGGVGGGAGGSGVLSLTVSFLGGLWNRDVLEVDEV